MEEQKTKKLSRAMVFILLFGVVSLFSDMTHEGASSIRGAYLSLLGASAGTIGFVSGLGEMIGYSMRYVFGKLTDKSKRYWPMTIDMMRAGVFDLRPLISHRYEVADIDRCMRESVVRADGFVKSVFYLSDRRGSV